MGTLKRVRFGTHEHKGWAFRFFSLITGSYQMLPVSRLVSTLSPAEEREFRTTQAEGQRIREQVRGPALLFVGHPKKCHRDRGRAGLQRLQWRMRSVWRQDMWLKKQMSIRREAFEVTNARQRAAIYVIVKSAVYQQKLETYKRYPHLHHPGDLARLRSLKRRIRFQRGYYYQEVAAGIDPHPEISLRLRIR